MKPDGETTLVTDENKLEFVVLRFKRAMLDVNKRALGLLLRGFYAVRRRARSLAPPRVKRGRVRRARRGRRSTDRRASIREDR